MRNFTLFFDLFSLSKKINCTQLIFLFALITNLCLGQSTETFSTAGTYTWVCPSGVTSLQVEAWGGGGAGGGTNTTAVARAGGGGGGGAFAKSTVTVVPGTSYTIVVGAGGTGVSAANGNSGSSSTFNTNTVIAVGGAGGLGHTASSATAMAGGNGGQASSCTGTVTFSGGNGGTSLTAPTSGGGGGGAGNTTNGGNASGATAGTGGSSGGGSGATGTSSNGNGSNSSNVGGGGSGGRRSSGSSTASLGGNGGAGKVVLTYTCPSISTLPFTENFDAISTGVPSCWALSGTTSNSIYHFNSYLSGQTGKCLRFDSYNNPTGLTSELITPTLDLSSLTTAELKFYYKNPTGGNFEVLISTNNGVSYTSLQSSLTNQSTWIQKTYSINSYISSTVKIKFIGTSNYSVSTSAYIDLDEIIVQAAPTCYVPTALTSSLITYQTATIGWSAPTLGTAPTSYEYEVRTSGAAGSGATGLVASNSVSSPTLSANLSGLSGGIAYTYYVRSNCGGGDFSAWSSAGTFTTLSCNVPTAITSSAITYTSATIGWTAPSSGTPAGYEYEIRTSGAAGSGSSGLITSGTTTSPTITAGLTDLTAGTMYSVYVRSNCYSGFNSAWTSASTFTTVKVEPTNQITNLAAGAFSTTLIPLTWTAAVTGTQAPDGYLVKASSISLSSIVDPADGTDPTNVTVFTSNEANKKQTTGTATSTTGFTGTAPGTMYHYKVYSYTNSGAGIDFKTDIPATLSHATKPNGVSSSVTSESITSSSIGFTWSSTSYLSGANEYIIFAKAGSAITSGTPVLNASTYTANATFGNGTAYEADASAFCVYKGDGTSINLTGLNPSTTYHFLMYAVVDTANSNGTYSYSSSTAINRTTLCAPISSLPWTEGFESVSTGTTVVGASTSLPNCWNSQSTQWASSSSATYNTAKTGSKYIRYAYSSTNAFIWTPAFQLTVGVTYNFSFYAQGDGFTGWNNDVYVNTSVSSTGATQLTPTYTPSGTGTASIQSYNLVTRTFTPSATGVYYFAIRGNQASSSPWYMAFDDFKLEQTPNTWTGNSSSSWNTASNWSLNAVPTSSDIIIISSNGSNAPIIDTNVTIGAGKSLTISGASTTLSIAPGKVLTIAGTADFGGKLVTFISDNTGSAMLGTVTGSLTGATNVKVERYIPQGKRAFRFLAPGVTTTNFISNNWQEATHITGSTTGANGFDQTESGSPSMYTYNNQASSGTGWTAISSTDATNLEAEKGYRLLVRGDRTSTILTAPAEDNMNAAITLAATGTIKTGTVTINASSTPVATNGTSNATTNGFSFVGNPYVSAVDWNSVTKTNLEDTYYVWDTNVGTTAQRGRYVSFSEATGINNYGNTGVSATNRYIQAGQAFFVKNTTLGTAGSLTFSESSKATSSPFVFRTDNQNAMLSVLLYAPTELALGGYPMDGITSVFGTNFDNQVGYGDVAKLESAGENITWFTQNKKLDINAQTPAVASDVLMIKSLRLGANKNYTFRIKATNFDPSLTGYLVDNYLNTQQEIDMTQDFFATFTTSNEALSYGEDRFKIVFNTNLDNDELNIRGISIYPNPVVDNQFSIQLPTSITGKVVVKIFTALGQEVYLSQSDATPTMIVNPKQTLATGVYVVSITCEGKEYKQKIMVK